MKFVHLSDLHIGKTVEGMRMLDDQKYILDKILEMIAEVKPDAVLISGDVYDRGIPPSEAVTVFDDFLVSLSRLRSSSGGVIHTFIISGNHDSPERLSFGNRLIENSGIHIAPVYSADIEPFIMHDEFGEINVYMLPFIKASHVQNSLTELSRSDEAEKILSTDQAVKKAVEMMNADKCKRNILLCHQYVDNFSASDEAVREIGGIDIVDAGCFEAFNYVAMGHLHSSHTVKTDGGDKNVIYYCGTPLKYSFNERSKSIPVVTIDEQGAVSFEKLPLTPLRDMRVIRGSFDDIKANYEPTDDYIYVIVEGDFPSSCLYELRSMYPNLISARQSVSDMRRTDLIGSDISDDESDIDIFMKFFEIINDRMPDESERKVIFELFDRAYEKSLALGDKYDDKGKREEDGGNASD